MTTVQPLIRLFSRILGACVSSPPGPPQSRESAVSPLHKVTSVLFALHNGFAVPVFLGFLALIALLFADVLFTRKAFFELDAVAVGYPLHYFAAQTLKNGQFPLWSPYYAFGFPFFLESQAGILYPFHIVLYLTPTDQFFFWYHTLLALHYALAGWFMFLWVRDLTRSVSSGIFAGITFMVGGYLMGHQIHLNIVEVVTWCPLILYLIGQTPRRGWRSTAFTIGVAFALQALAGHIPTLILFLPGAFAYALWLVVKRRLAGEQWLTAITPVILLFAGGLIGIILSLPQTLPQALYLPLSHRAGAPYLQPGIPLNHFIHLFVPFPPNFRWFEMGLFHGYLAWLLPIAALFVASREERHEIAALWSLVLFFFYLALGAESKLFRLLHSIPPFSLTRLPIRYSLEIGLFLPAAAGIAFAAVVRKFSVSFRALPLLLIVAQAVTLGISHRNVAPRVDASWLLKPPPYLLQIPRTKIPYRLFPTGLDQYPWQGPEAMVAQGKNQAYLSELVSQSLALYHQLFYAPAQAWLLVPAPSVPMMNGLMRHPDPNLYAAFGIRYLIVPTKGHRSAVARALMQQWNLPRMAHTPVAEVYENPGARPMAFLATRYKVVPDPWIAWKRFTDSRQTGTTVMPNYEAAMKTLTVQMQDDPDTVFLDREPPLLQHEASIATPDTSDHVPFPGEITDFRVTGRGFVIRGKAHTNALLVLLDLCLPGWRAQVNGKPAQLYRANFFFKAVAVPAGEFTASFNYGFLPVGNCYWRGEPATSPRGS